eukprot:6572121-Pyramimonas_sp.AAC.1
MDDGRASDLPPPSDGRNSFAHLRAHHSQVYWASRYRDKCSQVTCYRQAVGNAEGAPLCLLHLGGEAGRAAQAT